MQCKLYQTQAKDFEDFVILVPHQGFCPWTIMDQIWHDGMGILFVGVNCPQLEVCLFTWVLTALSAQTGYYVSCHNSRIIYHVGTGDNIHT